MSSKFLSRTRAGTVLATALFAAPVAWGAVEFTDQTYAPWNGVSGAAAWRGDGGNFEVSKVADIAADGTIGETYQMQWNNTVATTAKRFCSTCTTTANQGYVSPGMLLVYDASGYAATANGTFTPLAFGGLKVDALADVEQDTPYELNSPNAGGARYTDFGVANFSSYFEFNKSFIISRVNDLRCYGDVTIKAAEGATFKCTKALWIENNSTVALQGAGTVELTEGLRMNASSTLDLSAATRPTIAANVTFPAGATLVVPASTEPTTESPFTVCSGTLTVSGDIYVKVGEAEAALATVTVDGGAITGFEFPTTEATFDGTTDWPTAVPFGYTYTFVGGETAESAVAVPTGVAVSGTLKTTGYISLTGLEVKTGGTLEVVDGNTTATAATNGYGDKLITGNVIVRAGATLTPTQTDFLDYYNATASTVDVYGTFALGSHRISIKPSSGISFNLYPGAVVSGVGDGTAALDLYNVNSKINVYSGSNGGEVVIEGLVKTQNANTPIWVAADTTLKLNGGLKGGINKTGNGAIQVTGTIAEAMASTVSEGTVAFVDTTVALPLTVNAGKTVTASASEGVTVPLNVTMNASANITVSGAGTVNGTLTFGAKPAGTLTGLTTSTWKGTVSIPAIAAGTTSTQVPLQSYGNTGSELVLAGISGNTWLANGSATIDAAVTVNGDVGFSNGKSGATYTFTKVAGGTGNLSFASWSAATSVAYAITTIDADNYTGTIQLDGSVLTFNVGDILKAGAVAGEKVLPLTVANNATVNVASARLNGEAAKLAVTANGVYVAGGAATIGGVTTYYRGSSSAYMAVMNGGSAGDSFTVYDDATYGDLDGFSYDSETKTYTMLQMVAQFTYGVQTTKFATLAAACTAAEECDPVPTVVLLVALGEQEVPTGWEYNTPEASATEFGTLTKTTGFDPTTGGTYSSTAATKEAAEAEAKDAVVVPAVAEGTNYADLFDYTATGDAGNWTVTATIKEAVVTTVAEAALGVINGTGTLTVPAGLYYRLTTETELGTGTPGASTQSTGAAVQVTKPGTTQGFIKVELSPSPIQ